MAAMQTVTGCLSPKALALSWSEEDIISVFMETPMDKPDGYSVTGFVFPPEDPVAYVKFSGDTAQLKNHEYAFTALKAMPPDQTRGILIPEVWRSFEYGHRLFIVMEYIPGKTLLQSQWEEGWESRQDAVYNKIAEAIKVLMLIPLPEGQEPGPVGGGKIRHSLFKDRCSYSNYASIDELEKHLNKVSTLAFDTGPTVRLESNMCFYYSDFYPGNFILTNAGDVCIIDFADAGFLPPSFMSWALARSRWDAGVYIGNILKLPEHNFEGFDNMSYWFTISVDYIGYPKPEKKRGRVMCPPEHELSLSSVETPCTHAEDSRQNSNEERDNDRGGEVTPT